jgi:8-oxo-dGTP diphosphatase
MKIVLVSAVALIDGEGRILLAQRPEGKSMAGLWEFPGGKVEPGETPEAALVRELHEELGIDTWDSCLAPLTFASHGYPDFHLLMPLFACRKWDGIPQSREGSDWPGCAGATCATTRCRRRTNRSSRSCGTGFRCESAKIRRNRISAQSRKNQQQRSVCDTF